LVGNVNRQGNGAASLTQNCAIRVDAHLAGELPVGDVELGHHVAGRERHLAQRGRVPRRQDQAPVGRVALDAVDELRELVHALPGVVGVHVGVGRAEVAPLGGRVWWAGGGR
jgi:hypothetical protein